MTNLGKIYQLNLSVKNRLLRASPSRKGIAKSPSHCGMPSRSGFLFGENMSTSKLQRLVSAYLSIHFGGFTVRENIRPEWLTSEDGARLELDFFIEEIDLAIEVQGKQHFTYVPMFHGNEDGFKKQLDYDRIKKEKCRQKRINLIEISSVSDLQEFVGSSYMFEERLNKLAEKLERTNSYIAMMKISVERKKNSTVKIKSSLAQLEKAMKSAQKTQMDILTIKQFIKKERNGVYL